MEAFEVDNRTEFPPLLHRAERPTPIVASDDNRPRQDVHWLYAHGALMAFCLIGGIVTIICVPGNAWQQSSQPETMPPAACPMHHPYGRRSLVQTSDGMYSKNPHTWHYWVLLLLLIVGSLGMGWVFVLGFKHRAMLMVQAAIGVTVLIPCLSCVVNISQGYWVAGVIWGVFTGLLMWTVHAWKNQIDFVGRLLGIAGHVLVETPTLIGMSVGLQFAQGLLITLPAGYFALCAGLNGNLKPNPNRASDGYVIKARNVYVCQDEYGQAVHCCSWETNTWGQLYMIFLVLFMIWNTLLVGQVKLFTVAGAVAQWYFAAAPNVEDGTVVSTSTTPVKLPSGRVTRSLRHALGPSLGSLCLGAIVLGIVNTLKSLVDSMSRNRVSALCMWPVIFVLRIVLNAVEAFTKFTTVRLALTGECFMDAARGTFMLLRRNALEALGVWWLPSLILRACAVMMAWFYCWILLGMAAWLLETPGEFMMLIVGFFVCVMVLKFFCDLLLNVVDTVFMCYAMDRDTDRITRADIHQVLKQVPGTSGAVVEQPDGHLAYAAPSMAPAVTRATVV